MQKTWTKILPDAGLWEIAVHCLLFWHCLGGFFVDDSEHRALVYINI